MGVHLTITLARIVFSNRVTQFVLSSGESAAHVQLRLGVYIWKAFLTTTNTRNRNESQEFSLYIPFPTSMAGGGRGGACGTVGCSLKNNLVVGKRGHILFVW